MHRNIQDFYDGKYSRTSEISRTSKEYTIECVGEGHGLSLLDVGCGSGVNSNMLALKGFSVSGVDISPAAIAQYCAQGFDGHVVNLEEGMPFSNDTYDVVFCSEVIEHITMPEVLIAEMERILKPRGRLILSTPNSAFWVYRLLGLFGYTVSELQHPKHFQFFSFRSLCQLLTREQLDLLESFGRNMYLIIPGNFCLFAPLLTMLGLKKEKRFRTGKFFWHLSNRSKFFNSLFADTLVVVLEKKSQ